MPRAKRNSTEEHRVPVVIPPLDYAIMKDARRAQVARLRLRGMTQMEIATLLDVSQTTVSKDCQDVDAQHARSAVADLALEKGRDLDRIERAIAAIWPQVERGTVYAIKDGLVPLLQHKAALLGLNAPIKVDVTAEIRALAVAIGMDPDEAVLLAERALGGAA